MEADLLRISAEIERVRGTTRSGEDLASLRRRRDELIVGLHDAGLNNREVAALAGVTRWWVIKVLKRRDAP